MCVSSDISKILGSVSRKFYFPLWPNCFCLFYIQIIVQIGVAYGVFYGLLIINQQV